MFWVTLEVLYRSMYSLLNHVVNTYYPPFPFMLLKSLMVYFIILMLEGRRVDLQSYHYTQIFVQYSGRAYQVFSENAHRVATFITHH